MQRQLQLQYRGTWYDMSSNNHAGVLPHTLNGVYRGRPIQIETVHNPLRPIQLIDLVPITYRGVRLQAA